MNTPRALVGQWHIFGDDQPAAVGTLRFDPDSGLTLDAQRHRPPDLARALLAGGFEPPNVIHGRDSYGYPVSLFGCVLTRSHAAVALDQFEIRALHALLGAHFPQFNEIAFSNVRVTYSILDAWLARSALVEVPREAELPGFAQHHPPDITTTLPDGTVVTITIQLSQHVTSTSVTLGQSQFVRFALPQRSRIPSLCTDYIDPLGRLLSFLSGSDVFVDRVSLAGADQTSEIDWLHSNPGITTAKRSLEHGEGLIAYREIADQLPAVISRWFEYHARMEPILNLYFMVSQNPDMAASTRFLLLAQALEAYHSRSNRFSGQIQPTPAFRLRRDALIALVPAKDQPWLRENLKDANQKG